MAKKHLTKKETFRDAVYESIFWSRKGEKYFYMNLDIDSGQWSRIMVGEANFPMEKFPQFIKLCENNIALRWLANKCGFELVVMQKAFEDKIREKEEELEELKKRLHMQDEFIQKLGVRLKD